MLSAKVRFALLFSTVAFRLIEIGEHLERTLPSPSYRDARLSFETRLRSLGIPSILDFL